jgi:purine-binding chemotaxis protein CheW
MVDLVKIRKKAKKDADRNAGVPPAGEEASRLLAPEPEVRSGGEDAAEPAGGTPALPSKLDKFKESAGKRRDGVVLGQATDAASEEIHELLTFVLAGEHYAVEIERIIEIVTPKPVTRIPNADSGVIGIVSLRGTIVTLLDVRGKLRHPPRHSTDADTRVVVVDLGGEMLGFTVDRVLRVVKTAQSDIEPHPVVHVSEQDAAIRGVFRAGDALTILVDLDKLLAGRVLAAS